MSNDLYEANLKIVYNGTEYTVLDSFYVKGQDLYLVVKTQDVDDNKFPVQTYVIPI